MNESVSRCQSMYTHESITRGRVEEVCHGVAVLKSSRDFVLGSSAVLFVCQKCGAQGPLAITRDGARRGWISKNQNIAGKRIEDSKAKPACGLCGDTGMKIMGCTDPNCAVLHTKPCECTKVFHISGYIEVVGPVHPTPGPVEPLNQVTSPILPCYNPWCTGGPTSSAMFSDGDGNYYRKCKICLVYGPTRATSEQADAAWNARPTHLKPVPVATYEDCPLCGSPAHDDGFSHAYGHNRISCGKPDGKCPLWGRQMSPEVWNKRAISPERYKLLQAITNDVCKAYQLCVSGLLLDMRHVFNPSLSALDAFDKKNPKV